MSIPRIMKKCIKNIQYKSLKSNNENSFQITLVLKNNCDKKGRKMYNHECIHTQKKRNK